MYRGGLCPPFRPLARFARNEELKCPGRETRRGGRLGKKKWGWELSNSRMGWPAWRHPETASKKFLRRPKPSERDSYGEPSLTIRSAAAIIGRSIFGCRHQARVVHRLV